MDKFTPMYGMTRRNGSCPPPFKPGTPAYSRWYWEVKKAYIRQLKSPVPALPHLSHWADFYAYAKLQARANHTYNPQPKLFGTAKSKEYRLWYSRTRAAHAQLPFVQQDWPAWFAKAKAVEMKRQGLNPVIRNETRTKPDNVVPLNPVLTLPVDFDGPLRFEF